MKLKTVRGNHNKSLTVLGDVTVKVDALGFLEVSDNVGKQLLKKYPEIFFEDGYTEKKQSTPQEEFTKDYAQRLEGELTLAKETISELKNSIEVEKADKNSWTDKVNQLSKELEDTKKLLEEEKIANKTIVEKYETKITLLGYTVGSLQEACKKGGWSEDEWGKLNKTELVEYLLGKDSK